VQSFLAAELPPCVAVTAVGECFNYLFDRGNTPEELAKMFGRVYEALVPGGLFVFDVAGPGRVRGPGPQKLHREGEDWAVLVTVEEDRERRLLTRHITSFRQVGKYYRRDREVHKQRLFERAELASQLRGAGFRVRAFRDYGAWRFPPGHLAFVARRPGRV
jgi:hypothetical protein